MSDGEQYCSISITVLLSALSPRPHLSLVSLTQFVVKTMIMYKLFPQIMDPSQPLPPRTSSSDNRAAPPSPAPQGRTSSPTCKARSS